MADWRHQGIIGLGNDMSTTDTKTPPEPTRTHCLFDPQVQNRWNKKDEINLFFLQKHLPWGGNFVNSSMMILIKSREYPGLLACSSVSLRIWLKGKVGHFRPERIDFTLSPESTTPIDSPPRGCIVLAEVALLYRTFVYRWVDVST